MEWRFVQVVYMTMFALVATSACDTERYFGPFELNVPTPIQLRTDSRTFELPLDSNDARELDNLNYCQQNEPERELPCRCDYPVLCVDEQRLRLDYHLGNSSQYPVNATVWIGVPVPDQWPSPKQVPDLPRIALLASHTHRVKSGQQTDDTIDEDEMSQAQQLYTEMFFKACESEDSPGPVPLSFVTGLSMDEDDEGMIQMEFTVRVRRNK